MWHKHRGWIIAGTVLALLIITILGGTALLGEPLKNYAEREARERLPDYEITIGKLRLQPLRLAIDLRDVVVRLHAHPDPPLAEVPQLKVRVRFLPLFTGTIDANLHIEQPHLAATGQQLDTILHPQMKEDIKQEAVAWQDTLRNMMPVRLSASISDGNVSYRSVPAVEPIELHQLDLTAANVTNRPPENERYPSTLRVHARLADESEVALESRADLLAKPSPQIDGDVNVRHLELITLRPVTGQYNVQVRQGTLDLIGHVHYTAPTTVVEVNNLLLQDAKVDYVHTAQTKQKEVQRAKKGAETVKAVHQDPTFVMKVSHGKIAHSDVGFVNKAASPDYRVFLSDMNLEVQNFSNRPEEGLGTVKVTGNFMGSGPTVVTGSFRPEKPNPDFTLQVRIVKTPVDRMNKLLEAYGQLKAAQGIFAFFSDMTVKNNQIEGYVKPFLRDVEVYDPKQDKDQKTLKKLYEGVINGVLDLFKNQSTGQVATETDMSGPIENPHASTWQILEKLVQNAFFKAILPGFEGQPHKAAT